MWTENYLLSVTVVVFVWFAFVASLLAFLNLRGEPQNPPVSISYGYTVDVLVLMPFLHMGWFLTAIVYFLGCVLYEFIYGRIKLPKKG